MLHKMHRSNQQHDNTKFYKGFKAIKNKDCAFSITVCDPLAFNIRIN